MQDDRSNHGILLHVGKGWGAGMNLLHGTPGVLLVLPHASQLPPGGLGGARLLSPDLLRCWACIVQ